MATAHTAYGTQTVAAAPTPLSALNKLTAATLVGGALSLVYAQAILISLFQLDLTIFAVLELIAAALVVGYPVGRWRWTPLLGVLFGALVLVGNSGPIIYDLTHPGSFHSFAFMVVAVSDALVMIVAGASAALQNYRRPAAERHTPRFLAAALVAVVALGLGGIATAAIPQERGSGVSDDVLAQLPALTTPGFSFNQTELKAQVGSTVALRLENPHNVPHSFDIDELNVHVPMTVGENALALFKPTAPGTYTYYCALPGHREAGMVGTLVVEP